jgi:hypothetical protein
LANCPFCGRDVPPKLVLHGGTCPHCFGDIPGEDAPTDLGEVLKEQLHKETVEKARKRAMAPLFVLAPIAVVTSLIAGWYLWPVEVVPLELGDLAINLDFESFEGSTQQVVAENAPKGPKGAGGVAKVEPRPGVDAPDRGAMDGRNAMIDAAQQGLNNAGAASAAGPGGQVIAGAYTPEGRKVIGGVAGAPPAPEAAGGLAPPSTEASAGFGSLTANVARSGAILKDDEDIRDALKDTISARKGRLRQCYEQAAKTDEGLAGEWRVSFTIATDGSFKGVAVKPVNRSSAPFESCVRDQIAKWTLGARVEKERSLSFPLRFGEE